MSLPPEHIRELPATEKRLLLEKLLREKAAQPKHYPLSFGQERLWFMERLEPGSSVYNLSTSKFLTPEKDAAILQACLDEIVRRHEALRTTVRVVSGHPVQVVPPNMSVPLAAVDLRTIQASTRMAEVDRLVWREAKSPFDLAHGPLVRFCLLHIDSDVQLLIVTLHHLVSDGWSLNLIMHELTVLYDAYVAGRPSPLAPLAVQYGDYAAWQRQRMQGDLLDSHLSYWKQQLSGAPALTELPADHARPPVQTFHGAWQGFPISAQVCEQLQALSRRSGATLYMVLLTAFQILLLRYSGQSDSVIGTPVANRMRGEHEHVIGNFANMLVIRTDLGGNPGFITLLRRGREVMLEAYTHQDLPFEKLVEEMQPARHLGYHPLFQIMFAYHNAPTAQQPAVATEAAATGAISGTARFDLSLFMEDRNGGLWGTFEYCTDLFDHGRIQRMIGHFQTLLEAIIVAPDSRVWDLPIIPSSERQYLFDLNATGKEFVEGRTLLPLFEAQVARFPDVVAVAFGEITCGYDELDRRSNQLGRYLRVIGIGPDTSVALCVDRSIEMVVALFGILKAGGAFVPLDPAYPPERLRFMLADSQVPVLLTTKGLLPAMPVDEVRVVCLDEDWSDIALQSDGRLARNIVPDDLAYIIYTSGSTGLPKGVQVSHAALGNLLNAMSQQLELTHEDRFLAVTTLSFDIALVELFLPLTAGARVVIADRAATLDGSLLAESLKAAEATVMQATPVTWRLLLDSGWRGEQRLKILCGGEALTQDLADALCEEGARCWNLYGPTETTIYSTGIQLRDSGRAVSIGWPIANTRVYVVDQYFNQVPLGVSGDLYIGGHGVARGYLNRADLTADRFIPDPFSDKPGDRLYRTGDVARRRSDGSIEYQGRSDLQVKIRGFRIEPGEIEAVLRQHPAVRQAVVVARDGEASSKLGDRYLAAYVVPESDRIPNSELYDFMKAKLATYMLPSLIVWLDRLPLTPNGKVDRNALPLPGAPEPLDEDEFVAPRDPVELVVAGIWADVLGLDRLSVNDDFFALGGHSLLATLVASRLSDVLQIDLPVVLLFKASTVAELSRELLNHPSGGDHVETAAKLVLRVAEMSDDEVQMMMSDDGV